MVWLLTCWVNGFWFRHRLCLFRTLLDCNLLNLKPEDKTLSPDMCLETLGYVYRCSVQAEDACFEDRWCCLGQQNVPDCDCDREYATIHFAIGRPTILPGQWTRPCYVCAKKEVLTQAEFLRLEEVGTKPSFTRRFQECHRRHKLIPTDPNDDRLHIEVVRLIFDLFEFPGREPHSTWEGRRRKAAFMRGLEEQRERERLSRRRSEVSEVTTEASNASGTEGYATTEASSQYGHL
jgi:hypothetical protein